MAPTYTPLGSRSSAAIVALYVAVGACVLAVGADIRRIVVAQRLEDGRVLVDALLGADQLVTLASGLEVIAFLVAAALFLRWQAATRRHRRALGEPPSRIAVWLVPVVNLVAFLAIVAASLLLGDAADVAELQRMDGLRAAAGGLAALAASLAIAVVSRTTIRQEARAAAIGAPRSARPVQPWDESVSEGGLRVVSEEQARRSRRDP